jgi:PTS system beta-glucosides-specific IIC component
MFVVGNMATAACMFAVFFAKKDSKTKSISLSSGISSIFGIIEPALFGIAIPIRKVLFALMIATGIASGILQGMAIKIFSFAAPSVLSIPLFVNPDGSSGNLTGILICILIAVILAFVITYLVIKKEKAKDKGVVFSNGKSL